MCSASATNGDLPFKILLIVEKVTSIIGTAKTTNGKIIASAAAFITPVIESVASKNPENNAPESPIKIFAGLKLYVKNANIEPARINAISALIALGGVIATAIKPNVIELTVTTEPASPSTPSMKFTALLIPTIHKIVRMYDTKIFNSDKNGTESMRPPKRNTKVAIAICINNLNFALRL